MKTGSRCNTARKILLFWCFFIGVGAVAGAVGMFVAVDGSALGMQSMLPYFQVLPFSEQLFQSFLFPGIVLLCVNGITNLIAAAFLIAKKKAGVILGGVFGITLMLWICIQFVIFPMNFMSTTYFIFGALQSATGYAAWIFYKQESFVVNIEDYANIGTNKNEIVVYFSRLGYTKKVAYEAANKSGAEVYCIQAEEPVSGTKGFWWCGRFGMHIWPMPIEESKIDFSSYKKVTVCSPIWVFHICGPVRSFCKSNAGKIKNVSYIIVHHQHLKYKNAYDEMDRLLQAKHSEARSFSCHAGKYCELSV